MRKLLIASLWALLPILVLAAENASAAEPRFFLEEVEVLGLRYARPEIVQAESLLVAGQDFSEVELGAAMARIKRLPFVIDATFALRKGSERGRYRLEVEVEETQRFFFGQDLTFTRFTNSLAINTLLADNYSLSPGELAGMRFFAGRYTMLFASVSSGRGLQAGLTRYNLWDRRIFFSLGLQAADCCALDVFSLGIDPTFSSWSTDEDFREISLTLGMPIANDQSLRLQVTHSTSSFGERRNLLGLERSRAALTYRNLVHDQLELAFIRDTSDDPILPTRGYTFTGVFDAQDFSVEPQIPTRFLGPEIIVDANVPASLPDFRSRQLRLSLGLQQHFPFGSRQVISASARIGAGVGRVEKLPVLEEVGDQALLHLVDEESLDLLEGHFTLQYSLSLWNAQKTRERGDFRLESGVEFGYDRTQPTLGLTDNPLYRKGISLGVVFRNRWGIFRFTFQVADYGRGF